MQPNAVKTDILWCSSQREVDQLPTKPGDVGGSSVVRRTRPQCMDRQWSHNVHSHHQGRRQLRCVRRSLQCHISALRSSLWHSCCPHWTSATVSWQDCPRTNLTATAVSSPVHAATRLVFGGRRRHHVTPLLRQLQNAWSLNCVSWRIDASMDSVLPTCPVI